MRRIWIFFTLTSEGNTCSFKRTSCLTWLSLRSALYVNVCLLSYRLNTRRDTQEPWGVVSLLTVYLCIWFTHRRPHTKCSSNFLLLSLSAVCFCLCCCLSGWKETLWVFSWIPVLLYFILYCLNSFQILCWSHPWVTRTALLSNSAAHQTFLGHVASTCM